ncbi:MAG: class I SAM-dependent methyltransferase [Steroidobacteraceae bacterium]|jgi:predicted O-methyltransferase YrrM
MRDSRLKRPLNRLKLTPIGVAANIPIRVFRALGESGPRLGKILAWGFQSREDTNFTYNLTDDNLFYLAHTIAVVTGADIQTVRTYIREAESDDTLKQTVITALQNSRFRFVSDARCEFGRRLGWYAFVRILKPQIVVETGVDKGLGAILLCAALMKNRSEGVDGRYYGTDINPEAGWLLRRPYSELGEILVGDSIQSLLKFPGRIDLFINDSEHSAEYEYREYQTVAPKLTERAVVLGDNAHVTAMLAKFASESGMKFLYFQEMSRDHWYPGAGIGIAFKVASGDSRMHLEARP